MLTSTVLLNAPRSVFRIGPKYGLAAALLTRMSSRPWAWAMSRIRPWIWSMSPMWQARTSALPPAARIAAATVSQSSALRLDTITCAPCAASAFAIASPMPRLAPVTSATLPVRSNIFLGSEVMEFLSIRDGLRLAGLLEVREVVEVGQADAAVLAGEQQPRDAAVGEREVHHRGALVRH